MSQVQTLPASKIQTEGLQVRAETNRGHVDNIVELFGDECQWPAGLPVLTVYHDGKDYFLADGHHRYQAAQEAGCAEIPCEVRQGDRTTALWHALGSNADHGLPRSNEDKRNAVLMAYRLDPSLSDNAIAKRCRVSQPFVSHYLKGHRRAASTYNAYKTEPSQASPSCSESPWDHEPEARPAASTQPAASPSTAPASTPSTAGSSPGQAAAPASPAIGETQRTVRCADGRTMRVEKIGQTKKQAKPAPSGPVDALGVPLTPATAPAFLTALEMDGVVKLLREAQTRLAAIAGAPGAELLRQNALLCERHGDDERYRSPDIANAIKELQHWRPFSICPCCKGEPQPACQVCLGLPYTIRAAFERCPEQLQAQVKAPAESPADADRV
jgi:hypothetical protein